MNDSLILMLMAFAVASDSKFSSNWKKQPRQSVTTLVKNPSLGMVDPGTNPCVARKKDLKMSTSAFFCASGARVMFLVSFARKNLQI